MSIVRSEVNNIVWISFEVYIWVLDSVKTLLVELHFNCLSAKGLSHFDLKRAYSKCHLIHEKLLRLDVRVNSNFCNLIQLVFRKIR